MDLYISFFLFLSRKFPSDSETVSQLFFEANGCRRSIVRITAVIRFVGETYSTPEICRRCRLRSTSTQYYQQKKRSVYNSSIHIGIVPSLGRRNRIFQNLMIIQLIFKDKKGKKTVKVSMEK